MPRSHFLRRKGCKEWGGFPQAAKIFKLVKRKLSYEEYKGQFLIMEQNIHQHGDMNESSEQRHD